MSQSPYAAKPAQPAQRTQKPYFVRVEFLVPKDVHDMMQSMGTKFQLPTSEVCRLLIIEGLAAVKRGESLAVVKEQDNA